MDVRRLSMRPALFAAVSGVWVVGSVSVAGV
jgi:hypothetical protein